MKTPMVASSAWPEVGVRRRRPARRCGARGPSCAPTGHLGERLGRRERSPCSFASDASRFVTGMELVVDWRDETLDAGQAAASSGSTGDPADGPRPRATVAELGINGRIRCRSARNTGGNDEPTAPTSDRPPLGIRLLQALRKEPDWSTMTAEDLSCVPRRGEPQADVPRCAGDHRASRIAAPRSVAGDRTGGPCAAGPGVPALGRHRRDDLPLVLHVHGGGFVGTAVQCDWVNSHLAARLPAVVVSVEHRLLAPGTPLTAAVDDGWDVLDTSCGTPRSGESTRRGSPSSVRAPAR